MSAFDEQYCVGNLFRGEENLDYYPQVAMPPAEPSYEPCGYPQQLGGYSVEVPKPQQQDYFQPPQAYTAPSGYAQTYGHPQSPDYSWQQGGGFPYPQPAYQDPRFYVEPAVATPAYAEYQGPRAESVPTQEAQMRGGHHDQQKKKEKADDHHHTSLTTGLQALMGAGKLFCTGVDVLAALNNLT